MSEFPIDTTDKGDMAAVMKNLGRPQVSSAISAQVNLNSMWRFCESLTYSQKQLPVGLKLDGREQNDKEVDV